MSDRERVEALAKVLHRERHQGLPCGYVACWEFDKATEHATALLDSTAMRDLLAEAKADAWDEGSHATAYSGVTYTHNPYRETSNGGRDD